MIRLPAMARGRAARHLEGNGTNKFCEKVSTLMDFAEAFKFWTNPAKKLFSFY